MYFAELVAKRNGEGAKFAISFLTRVTQAGKDAA